MKLRPEIFPPYFRLGIGAGRMVANIGGIVPDRSSMLSLEALISNVNNIAMAATPVALSGSSITLTAAQAQAGVTRLIGGASGPFTVNLPPTARLIDALGPTVPLDGSFSVPISFQNEDSVNTGTLVAADASTTFVGNLTIAPSTRHLYLLTLTTPTTLTLTDLGTIGAAQSISAANVIFTAVGVGAVPRTDQDKDRDIVSAYDYMTASQVTAAKAGTFADVTVAVQAAIDALPATGGMLLMPIGTYGISSLTISKQITIQGQGMFGNGTYIIASTAAGKVFNCTGSSITIRDLCIDKNVVQSGGAYVYCDTGSSIVNLENIYMLNWFRGVQFTGIGNVSMRHLRLTAGVVGTGIGVRIDSGLGVYLDDVIVQNPNGSEALAGYSITNCGDVTMIGSHAIENIYGLAIQPGNGQVCTSVYATNCFFDNSTNNGLWIAPTNAAATMQRMTFANCWFSSSGASGVLIDTSTFAGTIDGIEFIGPEIYMNGSHGFQVQGTNSKRIKINGGKIAQNTGNGILMGANVSNWQVANATIGPIGGFTGNTARAITSLGGTSDDVLIMNNIVNGNTAGAFNIASTGARRLISSNPGYNPVGSSTITVGASPYTYTAGDSPETIVLNTGTVSLVSVGGTNMSQQTNGTYYLGPGVSMTVTYSVLPGMAKYVH